MGSQSYETIGRLFGRDYLKSFGRLLEAAGILVPAEAVAGLYVLVSLAFTILLSLILVNVPELTQAMFRFSLLLFRPIVVQFAQFVPFLAAVISFVFAFSIIAIVIYVAITLMADSRRKSVEDILPDFLVICASNVRAGMTIDQAMWYSAKPEFGLLAQEVNVVAKRTFGGVPFARALDHLATRFNSKIVKRTVLLIKQGLASGGRMAEILERTAQDARDMQIIRHEIAASLLMYVIFIAFAVMLGTPFLFGVASKLIVVMEGVFSQIPDVSGATSYTGFIAFKPQPPIITSEQFQVFVIISSIVTAICSSLMIGAIQNNNAREGIRYLPLILIVGTIVFFAVSAFLDIFLVRIKGGML